MTTTEKATIAVASPSVIRVFRAWRGCSEAAGSLSGLGGFPSFFYVGDGASFLENKGFWFQTIGGRLYDNAARGASPCMAPPLTAQASDASISSIEKANTVTFANVESPE